MGKHGRIHIEKRRVGIDDSRQALRGSFTIDSHGQEVMVAEVIIPMREYESARSRKFPMRRWS